MNVFGIFNRLFDIRDIALRPPADEYIQAIISLTCNSCQKGDLNRILNPKNSR